MFEFDRFERKVASTLFAEPPTATIEEALSYFMIAEDLSTKDWKENKLMVAKCHIAVKNYKEAVAWLLKAEGSPSAEQVRKKKKKIQKNYAKRSLLFCSPFFTG